MSHQPASPFTVAQLNALNHYVLTGRTSLLDGDNHTLPPEGEHWREEDDMEEYTTPIKYVENPSKHTPRPLTPVHDRRQEPNEPVNISRWRLAIPQGAHPPDDAPWSSNASVTDVDDDSADPDHRQLDLKPGPDISFSSNIHTSVPDPGNTDVNQWRYENFVDWWRAGMPEGEQPRVIAPPSSKTSMSDLGIAIPKTIPQRKDSGPGLSPAETSSRHGVEVRQENVVAFPSQESLTKVYYRLLTRNSDPLPVRDLVRDDKSIGVLFLDDLKTYRARDLQTLIFSRECSHTNPYPATATSFIHQPSPDSPPLKLKLKLYYVPPSESHNDRTQLHSTTSPSQIRLHDDDSIPPGVGVDEFSALIVKITVEESRLGAKSLSRAAKTCARKCGKAVAVVVRGLALGVLRIGEGLATFADCLSNPKGAK